MSNLSTINNQFHFNLPIDFVPKSEEEQYLKLIKGMRKPYTSVVDYLNSTIQSISFPSITFPTVNNEQNKQRKKIKWKTVSNIFDLFEQSVTITFLDVDSHLNYMILLDVLCNHYLNAEQPYDQSILVTLINENRRPLYNIQYRSLLWTDLDGNTFGYNDQAIQSKTFTASFTFNYLDLEFVLDKKDILTNEKYGQNLNFTDNI